MKIATNQKVQIGKKIINFSHTNKNCKFYQTTGTKNVISQPFSCILPAIRHRKMFGKNYRTENRKLQQSESKFSDHRLRSYFNPLCLALLVCDSTLYLIHNMYVNVNVICNLNFMIYAPSLPNLCAKCCRSGVVFTHYTFLLLLLHAFTFGFI